MKDFEGSAALLTDFGIEPPFDADTGKPEDLAHETYLRAEQLYQAKLADSQSVHTRSSSACTTTKRTLKNILAPFSDGRKPSKSARTSSKVFSPKAKASSTRSRRLVLAIIDQHWKEHLRDMDDLRSNVQHARFEQKDPLLIYKFELVRAVPKDGPKGQRPSRVFP